MDLDDITNAAKDLDLRTGASLANAAFNIASKLRGPKPQLRVTVKSTGGNTDSVTFTAKVSEVRNQVPALGVQVFAELDGIDGAVYASETFNLHAGELDRPIGFGLDNPKYGTLVPEFAGETTLYGRELIVTAYSERGAVDSKRWSEEVYDPETNLARYEVQQRAWRLARGEETESDRRADFLSRTDDDA